MSGEQTIETDGTAEEVSLWVWRHLVPQSGKASSVQGEALRAIARLRQEAQCNGNVNWCEHHDGLVQTLRDTLCSEEGFSGTKRASIVSDLDRLQHFDPVNSSEDGAEAARLPYVEDDLYDRMIGNVVEFCRLHPVVIPRSTQPRRAK